jgi:putative ABC transport system permease protein
LGSILDGLLDDVRLALRQLRRERAFTLAAIAMLALALGLNATVFTITDAVLFRGMPLAKRSDRLVYINMRKPSAPSTVLYADFEAWRGQAQAFEDLAFTAGGPIAFRDGDGHVVDMNVQRVTANTFGLLGVRPALGRDFVPADEAPGAAPVAILSYRFWENRFGQRGDIIGLTVHVNGVPTTIVGVMPEGFVFVYEQNLWTPLAHGSERRQRGFAGSPFGRLRDGATLQGARAELETINRRLAAADPTTDRSVAPTVMDYSGHVGPSAPMIYGSMWAAAWFVLLIACANLANLALVRTAGRTRELSTRIALGASGTRMIRHMLVESLTLASVGGVLAWWITNWGVGAWAAATASRYLVLDYRADSGTAAYLAAISVASALLCSLAPIVRVLQLGAGGAVNGVARGVTQGVRGKRLAAGLVAGQMALAIVLLSGAGILMQSLIKVVGADTGVRDTGRIVVAGMLVPSDRYKDPAARLAYFDRLEAQLQRVPGVQQTSVSSAAPVISGSMRPFAIEGRPPPRDLAPSAQFLTVGSAYFRLLGASVISGRDFGDGDRLTAPAVAIVNQSFAAAFWPGEEPIGKRFRQVVGNQPGEWRTVVGVVENVMQGDPLRQAFKPLAYVPFRQDPTARGRDSTNAGFNGANVLVRTSVPPAIAARAIRAAAENVDRDVTVAEFATLNVLLRFHRDNMDLAHAELGNHAAAAPIFAAIALLLAAIGLVAVIAHAVSQRTKEIGIRMAIGAAGADIGRMVLREGMRPVAIGLALGLTASFAVNRMLQSQLVGVSPYDPMTMAGAPVLLIAVALLDCHLPARRAMRVDPAIALRHE